VNNYIRFDVLQRDLFTCRYCGGKSPEAMLEVDHVVPLSNGGRDDMANLVTACYECNRGKGARLLISIPPTESAHEETLPIIEPERQRTEIKRRQRKRRKRALQRTNHWYPITLLRSLKRASNLTGMPMVEIARRALDAWLTKVEALMPKQKGDES
jgi:hypothetical protein